MHLGRFHAALWDISQHLREAKIPEKLEEIASTLDQIQSNPSENLIQTYRTQVEAVKKSATVKDIDLKKPYPQQIIDELNIRKLLNPDFSQELDEVSQASTFSASNTALKIRDLSKKFKISQYHLLHADSAFSFFEVEFERVGEGECEIGLLLPRHIVGETLPELAKEFSKFGHLFQQVNELTGAAEYNPKIRTISSSWWQFFVQLEPEQIQAWIDVTKDLVELWGAVLAIKKVKQELESKNVSEAVLKALEDDIQAKIDLGVGRVSAELRAKHGRIDDEGRANELENGITQGLRHMAKRMAQGGLVEIDVSPPKALPSEHTDDESIRQAKLLSEKSAAMRLLKLEAIETTEMASLLTSESEHVKLLSTSVKDDPEEPNT